LIDWLVVWMIEWLNDWLFEWLMVRNLCFSINQSLLNQPISFQSTNLFSIILFEVVVIIKN
jgi:hypothetical protein